MCVPVHLLSPGTFHVRSSTQGLKISTFFAEDIISPESLEIILKNSIKVFQLQPNEILGRCISRTSVAGVHNVPEKGLGALRAPISFVFYRRLAPDLAFVSNFPTFTPRSSKFA